MYRKLIFTLCLFLFSAAVAMAQEIEPDGAGEPDGTGDSAAKLITGIAIVGNDEAPKSLFIVPWKSSELGVEASLNRALNEQDVPVDRDVFLRQLDFYQVSTAKNE